MYMIEVVVMKDTALQKQLQGRLLRWQELGEKPTAEQIQRLHIKTMQGFTSDGRCNRCGTKDATKRITTPCTNCERDCYYCESCFTMGKIKSCTTLYTIDEAEPIVESKQAVSITYKGELSSEQQRISQELVEWVKTDGYSEHLVWAVTGAGKTEMVFAAIGEVLSSGGKVAFVSPRVDVCLEVAPRLQVAFSTVEQLVLYGKGDHTYHPVPLVIATTHQLLRFYRNFDLLIIDEIDAYPYSDEVMLQFASKRALKQNGKWLMLSATPNRTLRKAVKEKQLTANLLTARYHGVALPVPKHVWVGDWQRVLEKGDLPKNVRKWIMQRLSNNSPFLLFVPEIKWLEPVYERIKKHFPTYKGAYVFSGSYNRKETVEQMRQGKLDYLVTTTVLERGVTFEGIDVGVLGSGGAIFTSEVLMQIAGRVGRSYQHPRGEVVFWHYGKTIASIQAVSMIKELNRLAREKGLIQE